MSIGQANNSVVGNVFNVPVLNALARTPVSEFSVPGSLVRVREYGPPVTAGLAPKTAIYVDRPVAFATIAPDAEMQRWVMMSYPEDARDIPLSGWINGADHLTRKAAAVAMTYGKSRIVLSGFRLQRRGQTHTTFPMVFNALWWE